MTDYGNFDWWKLQPIITPLPRGFMDDDRSHALKEGRSDG